MRRKAKWADFTTGFTLREFIDVRELLGSIPLVPKIFEHGEPVKGKWVAWRCSVCKIVKLEVEPGPLEWYCEICRLKGKGN